MSKLAVASSKIRISRLPNNALVKHNNYFYPTDSEVDALVISLSNFLSKPLIVSSNPVVVNASRITFSVCTPRGSIFLRIDPENTKLV
jgi:hypothetical protein